MQAARPEAKHTTQPTRGLLLAQHCKDEVVFQVMARSPSKHRHDRQAPCATRFALGLGSYARALAPKPTEQTDRALAYGSWLAKKGLRKHCMWALVCEGPPRPLTMMA